MTAIAGKQVLITGGASGIGRLMALRIAERGGKLILWDINQEALDRTCNEIAAAGDPTVLGQICDVSDREQVYAKAAEAKAERGSVDILINNAGIVSGQSFLELPDEKIEATFRINTMALFWTTKAFLGDMMERNSGHVVTISSASGLIGVAKLADYSASKWAAFGMDESLRFEMQQRAPGVKTTVVCPYYIDTGMFDGVKSRFSFLLPILKEEKVADGVIKAIEKDRARLMMPPIVYTVPILRGLLPPKVFDMITNILGINASMEEFKGRK
jgi:all-trans-retinol dehydrogenase (NAD+)